MSFGSKSHTEYDSKIKRIKFSLFSPLTIDLTISTYRLHLNDTRVKTNQKEKFSTDKQMTNAILVITNRNKFAENIQPLAIDFEGNSFSPW